MRRDAPRGIVRRIARQSGGLATVLGHVTGDGHLQTSETELWFLGFAGSMDDSVVLV